MLLLAMLMRRGLGADGESLDDGVAGVRCPNLHTRAQNRFRKLATQMEGFGGFFDTLKDSGKAYVSNDPPAARGEAAAGGSRLTDALAVVNAKPEDVKSQIDELWVRIKQESNEQLEERIKRNRDASQIVDDSRMEEEMRKWRSFLMDGKNRHAPARERIWDKLKALIAYQVLLSRVSDEHAAQTWILIADAPRQGSKMKHNMPQIQRSLNVSVNNGSGKQGGELVDLLFSICESKHSVL